MTEPIALPAPRRLDDMSLEEAIRMRRSVRHYRDEPLTLAEVSQLLWAAQGVTSPDGRRAAPSAGALYPLETFLVAGRVSGLPEAVYRYRPQDHRLVPIVSGDRRQGLCDAALGQGWVRQAPASIVLAALYSRTTGKYGQRGRRYVHLETGCAAQNIYLQAAALGLGTVFVGAFDDAGVQRALSLSAEEEPLAILPVGRLLKTEGP